MRISVLIDRKINRSIDTLLFSSYVHYGTFHVLLQIKKIVKSAVNSYLAAPTPSSSHPRNSEMVNFVWDTFQGLCRYLNIV